MDFIIVGSINKEVVRRFAEEIYLPYMSDGTHGNITIILNSDGGHEQHARALAGMIKTLRNLRTARVTTHGFGNIHSAAVTVFAAGGIRKLCRYASVMVHETNAGIEGRTSSLKSQISQLAEDERTWCEILEGLTGTKANQWEDLHRNETYLTPQDALELNLATELI